MTRAIGYYVHHQGAGHWQRACIIAGALRRPCTLIGSFKDVDRSRAPGLTLDLPDDRQAGRFDGCDGMDERPLGLHYAPVGHGGVRTRMAAIAAWIERAAPSLMIVDVSVEVALLARLLSVPTLVVRLAGRRNDPAHLEAFRSAERLIAPFPAALDGDDVTGWVRRKTIYAGFLSMQARPGSEVEDGRIVVVFGRGGEGIPVDDVAAAACAVPDRDWHVFGPVVSAGVAKPRPPNLHIHGWVDDIASHIARASLVIGRGGDGIVAAVATAGKRFVCLPEARPYDEQAAKVVALVRMGAAVTHEGWPAPDVFAQLVACGLALDPEVIASLADAGAIQRLAERIDAIADDLDARHA